MNPEDLIQASKEDLRIAVKLLRIGRAKLEQVGDLPRSVNDDTGPYLTFKLSPTIPVTYKGAPGPVRGCTVGEIIISANEGVVFRLHGWKDIEGGVDTIKPGQLSHIEVPV